MTCLVDDYGPAAWTGRVIDLSRGSFEQVDNLGVGTIPVAIRVAGGPTGLELHLYDNIHLSAIEGYNLCGLTHSTQFCNANRQLTLFIPKS